MLRRNFPSFIEAFLDYSKNVGAPEKFLLWSAISGIGAALERKTWVSYNGIQVIYPNLYIMLIADSGIAKKSTATRALTEVLYELEDLRFMSTQLSAASLIEQLSEAGSAKVFEFAGTKYKNSSLFAYSSEAKTTIGGKTGLEGVQELLTDFYDCGDPNIWSETKGWSKKLVGQKQVTIMNPCLNLLMCSTPTWLNESIGKSGVEGGFASRVLFVTQKERPGRSVGWLDEDELGEHKPNDMKKFLVSDLKQINALKGRYRTGTGWKEEYNKLQRETDDKIDQGGDMKSYYSRKMWHCLKLSQILAADKSNDLILSPEHLIWARSLLEEIEPDMYSAFSTKGENKNLASFHYVWEIIRRKKVWNKRELVGVAFKHATSTQLDEHLRTLVQMGKIEYVPGLSGMSLYKVLDSSPLGQSTTSEV